MSMEIFKKKENLIVNRKLFSFYSFLLKSVGKGDFDKDPSVTHLLTLGTRALRDKGEKFMEFVFIINSMSLQGIERKCKNNVY